MSAASRAEARRKAILSRGTDRLAKLTTSARGEDAPAYMHADPPLPNLSTEKLVGKIDTNIPDMTRVPPLRSVADPTPLDPSVWSQEQQKQFLDALMGGGPMAGQPQSQDQMLPLVNENTNDGEPPGSELASVLSSFSQFSGTAPEPSTKPGANNASGKSPATPTRLQKIMPLIHLSCVWCLLAYFILWKEPRFAESRVGNEDGLVRWAELAWRRADKRDWVVQSVPFFWAFTTLQIILHSMRTFSGFDQVQPTMVVSLVLPHLPPSLSTIILAGLTYLQVGGVFLDDIAGLVVGIGLIVGISSWMTGSRGM